MVRIQVSTLMLFNVLLLSAQSSWLPTYQLPINCKQIVESRLGQSLLLDVQNEVYLLSEKGQIIDTYKNDRYGGIGSIDINNPMSILVYYKDYGTLNILDRSLAVDRQLNLQAFDYLPGASICLGFDNKIWLFDLADNRLKKINLGGETEQSSQSFAQLFSIPVLPNFMIEKGRQVFVNLPELGIAVFDIFGQFKKLIDIKGLNNFQIIQNEIYFFEQGQYFKFNLQSLLIQAIETPTVLENEEVVFMNDGCFVIGEKYLKYYTSPAH